MHSKSAGNSVFSASPGFISRHLTGRSPAVPRMGFAGKFAAGRTHHHHHSAHHKRKALAVRTKKMHEIFMER